MAIKTVTQANLADHVAEKRAQGANISTQEQVAAIAVAASKPQEKPEEGKPEEGSRIVATGEEKLEGAAPEPQGTPQPPKQRKENPVQARIDELTREKRELEEFAEGEYTGRISAQRRIQELEGQLAALQPKPQEKVEEDPEPKPSAYKEGENEKFLSDWGAWNRRQAKREFEAEQTKKAQEAEQQRLMQEANERRANSVKSAREAFADFDEVIKQADQSVAMQRLPAPPAHIQAVLQDSDYSAHLLYHFATNPDEAKRIFNLRPARAALELGRLETKFAKGEPAKQAEPPATNAAAPAATPTSRAPPPMPSLTAGPGDVPWDPSAPQPFREYMRHRIDENRRNGRRGRH